MIVCGTGHRPPKLGGYTDEIFDRLVLFATRMLKKKILIKHSKVIIISGLALGWDQALAIAAKENLGLETWGYAPCHNQDSKWPQWSKDKYAKVLSSLDKLIYAYEGNYPGSFCMIKRDHMMVDDSKKVLALWDGSEGGTGSTVKYAREKSKPVINVWEHWSEL